jgi:hypothetical protein
VIRGEGRATNIRKYISQPDMSSSPPAVYHSLFDADGTLGLSPELAGVMSWLRSLARLAPAKTVNHNPR